MKVRSNSSKRLKKPSAKALSIARRSSLALPVVALIGGTIGLSPIANAVDPVPSIATPPKTVDQITNEARLSPLFRVEFPAEQLGQMGLETVRIDKDVLLDMAGYLKASSLRNDVNIQALFNLTTQKNFLRAAPLYEEKIIQLTDRMVVDRRLTVSLKPGACLKPNLPPEIAGHCFVPKKGELSADIKAELVQIRAKLKAEPDTTVVSDGVTAARARTLDDLQLLDLMLNRDDREVVLVSVVPTQLSGDGLKERVTKPLLNGEFSTPLPSKVVPNTMFVPVPRDAAPTPTSPVSAATTGFAPRYFLTGFTLGREFSDTFEHTLARKTFWHGRYYLQFSYRFGASFGLRLPFSMAVSAQPRIGDPNARDVSLAVAPVNVSASGAPAYPAVGLDSQQYFGGKEFLLGVSAGCRFYASIPGPNVNIGCPSIGKDYSSNFDPVIGSARSNLGYLWLPGELTGLSLSAGPATASVDVGVNARMTNGRIGVRVRPSSTTGISGLSAADLLLSSSNPVFFQITPRTGPSQPTMGFTLSEPKYGFQLDLAPAVQARVGIDVGPFEYNHTIGPYSIDALSIHTNFTLGRHSGTVSSHSYEVSTAPAGVSP